VGSSGSWGLSTFLSGYYETVPYALPLAKAVSASESQTSVVTTFGFVETWGDMDSIVLGHSLGPCGTMIANQIAITFPCAVTIEPTGSWPVPDGPPLQGAAAVASGSQHSCAILTDHSIVCWGRNPSGQLGNGTTASSAVPVKVQR
jgi:hypothetical protein